MHLLTGRVLRVHDSGSQTVLLTAHVFFMSNFMALVFESLLQIIQA